MWGLVSQGRGPHELVGPRPLSYDRRMFVERVEVTGFAGLPSAVVHLDRVSRIGGSGRARTALFDAMQLFFGAFDPPLLDDLLRRWLGRDVELLLSGAPVAEAATWTRGPGVRRDGDPAPVTPERTAGLGGLIDPHADGTVTVSAVLSLDPPQFGALRANAVRDARLVEALSDGARLTVKVGARFSPAWDAVGVDLLAFAVGEVAFPIAGAERPAWLTPFLGTLARRFARGPAPESLWRARATSWSAPDRRAFDRARAALAAAPFELGAIEVFPEGIAAVGADGPVLVRHLGPDAEAALGLCGAVLLSGSDIYALDPAPPAFDAWLAAQVEGDASALEQVVFGALDGTIRVG